MKDFHSDVASLYPEVENSVFLRNIGVRLHKYAVQVSECVVQIITPRKMQLLVHVGRMLNIKMPL
jgi:hypothetical protein